MKRSDLFIAAGLALGAFVLYVRTLAPSLLYGDSAEFQTIAYTLGMGHPTGYPVYILFARLFALIPAGEIAYRVNLLSAFCAALTVGIVYLIIRRLSANPTAAVFGSLTLAFTPLFWKHASMAEIYTPSAACWAIILLAVLQWKETRRPHWIFLAGLVGGLSLGIHTTVTLGGIAILLYLGLSTRQRVDWLYASGGALVGVVLFVTSFLFLDFLNSDAGYYNTAIYPSLSVWGMTRADFDSPFERLAFLYFPPQFRGQFLSAPVDDVKGRLTDFVKESTRELWFALLGLLSLVIPRRGSSARWREAVLFLLAFVTFVAFAVTYDVYDFDVYYIPAILTLSILTGLGVSAIVELSTRIPRLPRFTAAIVGIVLLIAAFYPSMTDISFYWKERIPPGLEDWERYFYQSPDARKLEVEEIVSRLEDEAILFTDWDRAYDFYYVAHVLQGRTQMDFHEAFPQEGITRFADSAIEYIQANIDHRPIYFTERPAQLAADFKITRAGSDLFRIERK